MSKAFSDKISQIVAHYPGLSYSPAFLEGPVTKFFLDRAVSEGYIHIFQIANRIHLQNSKYDAESTINHNSANSSLKDGVLIFSSYDPDLKDVFDFLNQNFPEKHYASFWYEQCKSERNEDADDSFGEDFMDLICKACCQSVSKYCLNDPLHNYCFHIILHLSPRPSGAGANPSGIFGLGADMRKQNWLQNR